MESKTPIADEINKMGREAFNAGTAASECPYSFNKSKFWPSDYEGFNRDRWKLDAWMHGWLSARKEVQP